jgi:hypothetical protein
MTAGALGVERLGVEDRLFSRVVSVTRRARLGKRCVKLFRVGERPIVHDVTPGAVPPPRDRLMRGRVRPRVTVTSLARLRRRAVEEISLCPIRIAPMATGALRLEGLGMKGSLLSRLVFVTGHARRRKRRVDDRRPGGNPMVFRVTVLASRRQVIVRWIDRGFSFRFVAAQALRLAHHPRLVGGTARLDASGSQVKDQNPSNHPRPHGSMVGKIFNPGRLILSSIVSPQKRTISSTL